MSGFSSPREALADLLWSSADRHKAMQSLRQALRQLKTAEQEAGIDIVKSLPGHVTLDATAFTSDLGHLLSLLEKGRTEDFREAENLWRGDFLAGFEDIDPDFSDWLTVERERVRSEVTSAAFRHLNQIRTDDGGNQVEAGANFLLKIDPALEPAHRILIRLYKKLGHQDRAEQQFKACEREMRIHLDEVPDEETRSLLEQSTPSAEVDAIFRNSGEVGAVRGYLPNSNDVVHLPEISIISSSLLKKGLNDAVHLREEIVSGLSSFRSFDLYESEYVGDENSPRPTLVEGHELGCYLLRFRHDERSGKVVVQFEDRGSGQIVFNEIVDLALWEGIVPAASQIVSRIHGHSIGKLRNPTNSAVFARWCQADSLLWDFTPQSDEKAMRLLDDIEQTNRSFSMIYSARASIIMKRELHFPLYDKSFSGGMGNLLSLAEKSIMLDPWQAMNQRIYGWALILSNMPDEARRAFQNAGRLSAADPSNLMSVAEGLAFSGDVSDALATAERAFSLFSFVPRVFYEYLANIYFAAEDYENAIAQIERGAGVGVGGLTTRVAALLCSGREAEALQTLQRFSDQLPSNLRNASAVAESPEIWRKKVNFFQNEKVRNDYDRGAIMVQNFLFNGAASV
ncbi:BTAD domain-containing putative transcriptional regulator [uncultured Roseibium sp.]|uniref:BTAD domain-containing putative transcriptional regulator n=1 Tax=uncultured Roseibium sp. TaxID=1936171 RepID=UPI002628A307|nr:BTAD domain-containing putative transcriptional regulator [uncultured Roseibium sp.]